MHSVYGFEWPGHDFSLLHIMHWYTSLIFQLLFQCCVQFREADDALPYLEIYWTLMGILFLHS